jgi:hypothetical protein
MVPPTWIYWHCPEFFEMLARESTHRQEPELIDRSNVRGAVQFSDL